MQDLDLRIGLDDRGAARREMTNLFLSHTHHQTKLGYETSAQQYCRLASWKERRQQCREDGDEPDGEGREQRSSLQLNPNHHPIIMGTSFSLALQQTRHVVQDIGLLGVE